MTSTGLTVAGGVDPSWRSNVDEDTVQYQVDVAPWLGRVSLPGLSRDGVTPGTLYLGHNWQCPVSELCPKNRNPAGSAWADCRCYLLAALRVSHK